MACQSGICYLLLFSGMLPGTIITVVGKSGFVYGPAEFISLNIGNCIVTLKEQDLPSPGFTTTIQISCDDIESVITTSD